MSKSKIIEPAYRRKVEIIAGFQVSYLFLWAKSLWVYGIATYVLMWLKQSNCVRPPGWPASMNLRYVCYELVWVMTISITFLSMTMRADYFYLSLCLSSRDPLWLVVGKGSTYNNYSKPAMTCCYQIKAPASTIRLVIHADTTEERNLFTKTSYLRILFTVCGHSC